MRRCVWITDRALNFTRLFPWLNDPLVKLTDDIARITSGDQRAFIVIQR